MNFNLAANLDSKLEPLHQGHLPAGESMCPSIFQVLSIRSDLASLQIDATFVPKLQVGQDRALTALFEAKRVKHINCMLT